MIAVLARLGSPEIAGQYALGIALSVPLLVLAQFSRREPGAADIRITSLSLALVGIAAVGFLEHGVQDRTAVALVVVAEAVEWIADLYAGPRGAISCALHYVLPMVALGVVFGRTGHVGSALLAVLIVRLLALFCYDFRMARRDGRTCSREEQVTRLAGVVPCYFIAHILGYQALGVFAAMASVVAVAIALGQSVGRTATPHDDGDRHVFGRMIARMSGLGLMAGLLGAMFGTEPAGQVPLILSLFAASGGAFVATLLGRSLLAERCADWQMPLEIAAVGATAVACLAMVPRAGLLGAACALVFGSVVQIAGQLCVLRSIQRRTVRLALLNAPLA